MTTVRDASPPETPAAARPARLLSLEMLRGFAATALVFYHVQLIFTRILAVMPFHAVFGYASRGIDLFFVLSGFIITHVHRRDWNKPERLLPYAYKRIIRLYPAVLIMTTFAIIVYSHGFGGAEKHAKLTLGHVLASYLLLAQQSTPLVNVTWTLKYEIFFYVLFAFVVVRQRLGLALIGIWQAATLGLVIAGIDAKAQLATFYFRPFCLEFGIGMAVALAAEQVLARCRAGGDKPDKAGRTRRFGFAAIVAGVAGFLATQVYALQYFPPENGIFDVLTFGIASGLTIFGFVVVDTLGPLRIPKPLLVLGTASYSMYLVHFSVISMVATALYKHGSIIRNDGVALLAVLLGILGGIAFHYGIDGPVHRRLARWKGRPGAAARPVRSAAPLPSGPR